MIDPKFESAANNCRAFAEEGRDLRGYQRTIAEATGRTDRRELAEIEESMRQDIFHSTLDWQTREQLIDGARQAEALLIELNLIPRIGAAILLAITLLVAAGPTASSAHPDHDTCHRHADGTTHCR